MKIRLTRIPLSCAVPGMKLAEAVSNKQGNPLLLADTELTETLLTGLWRHKVDFISILVEDRRSEAELAAERAAVTDRVRRLFRNYEHDPDMQALCHLILEYRLEQLS